MPNLAPQPPWRRRSTTFALALVLVGCSWASPALSAGAAAAARPPATRAMWVWNGSQIAGDAAQEEALISFCRKTGVTVLFVDVVGALKGNRQEQVRAFVRTAHQAGLRVLALYGDPAWALQERHAEALQCVNDVIACNGAGTDASGLDGLQFDVEPYLISGFRERHAEILAQYLEMCRQIVDLVAGKSPALEVGFAIPFWLDDENPNASEVRWHESVKPAAFHLFGLLDRLSVSHVAIMAYRDQADGPNGTIAHSSHEVEYAARNSLRVGVWVGQETAEVKPPDPPTISFFGRSYGDLQAETGKIDAAFARYPSYRGVALHHYTALRQLIEKRR